MDSSRGTIGSIMSQAAKRLSLAKHLPCKEESTMQHTTIAVDLAKSVFELAVSDRPGQVSERHRLSRTRFERFFAQRQPATVLLEACSSAHHWAREFRRLGHDVVLLPPHIVRRYVGRNKTDRADAKGLLEAYRNEDIHPVPIKSIDQHVLAALHRYRSAYLAERTARINTTRGLLRELGLVIPVGARQVVPRVSALIEDPESTVPHALRPALYEACAEIRSLETRIRDLEHQLEALAQDNPVVKRLRTIPGIGLLTSTALVAFVGDLRRFRSGRRFASYLGLTPSERSSALVRRLGKISKRGDTYLRMLLIHGARSVLRAAKLRKEPTGFRAWALGLERRRGHNVAAVALANKLARFAYTICKEERDFRDAA